MADHGAVSLHIRYQLSGENVPVASMKAVNKTIKLVVPPDESATKVLEFVREQALRRAPEYPVEELAKCGLFMVESDQWLLSEGQIGLSCHDGEALEFRSKFRCVSLDLTNPDEQVTVDVDETLSLSRLIPKVAEAIGYHRLKGFFAEEHDGEDSRSPFVELQDHSMSLRQHDVPVCAVLSVQKQLTFGTNFQARDSVILQRPLCSLFIQTPQFEGVGFVGIGEPESARFWHRSFLLLKERLYYFPSDADIDHPATGYICIKGVEDIGECQDLPSNAPVLSYSSCFIIRTETSAYVLCSSVDDLCPDWIKIIRTSVDLYHSLLSLSDNEDKLGSPCGADEELSEESDGEDVPDVIESGANLLAGELLRQSGSSSSIGTPSAKVQKMVEPISVVTRDWDAKPAVDEPSGDVERRLVHVTFSRTVTKSFQLVDPSKYTIESLTELMCNKVDSNADIDSYNPETFDLDEFTPLSDPRVLFVRYNLPVDVNFAVRKAPGGHCDLFVVLPTMSGWMVKAGGSKKMGGWKRRYFRLEHGKLSYFKSSSDSSPISSIPIATVSSAQQVVLKDKVPGLPSSYVDSSHCHLELETPNRTYHFIAESKEVMERWKGALALHVSAKKGLRPGPEPAGEKVAETQPSRMSEPRELTKLLKVLTIDGQTSKTIAINENLPLSELLPDLVNRLGERAVFRSSNPRKMFARLEIDVVEVNELSRTFFSLGLSSRQLTALVAEESGPPPSSHLFFELPRKSGQLWMKVEKSFKQRYFTLKGGMLSFMSRRPTVGSEDEPLLGAIMCSSLVSLVPLATSAAAVPKGSPISSIDCHFELRGKDVSHLLVAQNRETAVSWMEVLNASMEVEQKIPHDSMSSNRFLNRIVDGMDGVFAEDVLWVGMEDEEGEERGSAVSGADLFSDEDRVTIDELGLSASSAPSASASAVFGSAVAAVAAGTGAAGPKANSPPRSIEVNDGVCSVLDECARGMLSHVAAQSQGTFARNEVVLNIQLGLSSMTITRVACPALAPLLDIVRPIATLVGSNSVVPDSAIVPESTWMEVPLSSSKHLVTNSVALSSMSICLLQACRSDRTPVRFFIEFPSRKGWLMKRGPGSVSPWSKRWFVLGRDSLLYYKKKEDQDKKTSPKGSIDLSVVERVTEVSSGGNDFPLDIHTKGRVYHMNSTVSSSDRREWIDALDAARRLASLRGRFE